jgi:3-dehydroquinate synthase
MVGSARLAAKFGYSADIAVETERLFRKFGLPVRIPASCPTDEIMNAMLHDKKFAEGNMVFIVPTAIGSVEIRNDVPTKWVTDIVDGLREGNEHP